MPERRRKREIIEVGDYEDQEGFYILEPIPVELGTGYSLSISHDEEGEEILQVKTYGKLDRKELLRELRYKYPKAKIEGLKEASIIKVSSSIGKRKKKEKSPTKP